MKEQFRYVLASGVLGAGAFLSSCGGDGKEADSVTTPTEYSNPTHVVTSTPEITPTPSAEQAKTPPYELGWKQTFGEVEIGIQKEAMVERPCENPGVPGASINFTCPGVSEVYLTQVNEQDPIQLLNEGTKYAFYKAWKTAYPDISEGISFEQYLEKLNAGEDLSFGLKGFKGHSYINSDIRIDPRDPVTFVFVANSGTQIHPYKGWAYGYRVVDEEGGPHTYIEMYDFTSGGLDHFDPAIPSTPNFQAGGDFSWALSLMGEKSVQKEGRFEFSQVREGIPNMHDVDRYITPIKINGGGWQSIVRTR